MSLSGSGLSHVRRITYVEGRRSWSTRRFAEAKGHRKLLAYFPTVVASKALRIEVITSAGTSNPLTIEVIVQNHLGAPISPPTAGGPGSSTTVVVVTATTVAVVQPGAGGGGSPPTPPPSSPGAPKLPTLVVTGVHWTPSSPQVGDAVIFSADVSNTGDAPTPTGIGLAFSVDGAEVSSVGANTNPPLAPAASETLTANAGPSGSAPWMATPGSHAITATANNERLFKEGSDAGDTASASLNVLPSPTSIAVNWTTSPWGGGEPNQDSHVVATITTSNGKSVDPPAGTLSFAFKPYASASGTANSITLTTNSAGQTSCDLSDVYEAFTGWVVGSSDCTISTTTLGSPPPGPCTPGRCVLSNSFTPVTATFAGVSGQFSSSSATSSTYAMLENQRSVGATGSAIWFGPSAVDLNPPGLSPPAGSHYVAIHWYLQNPAAAAVTVALSSTASGLSDVLQPSPQWPGSSSPALNEPFDSSYLGSSLSVAPDPTFTGTDDQAGWTLFLVPNGQVLGSVSVQPSSGQAMTWQLPEG